MTITVRLERTTSERGTVKSVCHGLGPRNSYGEYRNSISMTEGRGNVRTRGEGVEGVLGFVYESGVVYCPSMTYFIKQNPNRYVTVKGNGVY